MNRENIKRVRDVIAALPPERFDMRWLFSEDGHNAGWAQFNNSHSAVVKGCNTAACIAGWTLATLCPRAKGDDAVVAGDLRRLQSSPRCHAGRARRRDRSRGPAVTLTFDTHAIDGTTVIYEGRRPVITVHGNAEDPEAAKALARKVAAVGEMERALSPADRAALKRLGKLYPLEVILHPDGEFTVSTLTIPQFALAKTPHRENAELMARALNAIARPARLSRGGEHG